MVLDPSALTVDVSVKAEELPKGSSPPTEAAVRFRFTDEYDPGEHPATVGGSIAYTSSGNYKSVSVTAYCTVPARANIVDMSGRQRLAYEFMAASLEAVGPKVRQLANSVGVGDIAAQIEVDDEEILNALKRRALR